MPPVSSLPTRRNTRSLGPTFVAQACPSLIDALWLALWPLVADLVRRDELTEAVSFARALLDPPQQPLPNPIATTVEMALAAWDRGESDNARDGLERALEFARKSKCA
jgi:hypothetical protein